MTAPASRLSTLPPWPWDPIDPRAPRTLGYAVAGWAERTLVQPNGPRAGKPFRFTRDQLIFLLWWYAVDENGVWLFNHGVRRLAKGSGKSPFAAVWALIEFCGPCRLERFDDRVPGGCRGKPMAMPWVQIAATAESQTKNTMRMVRAFAPKGSRIVEQYQLDPGKTQYYKLPEGTLEVITSSFTAAEGAEPSALVGDESEHWKPSNGGADLSATIEDNLAKSGARMLETANAWVPGASSVAEESWDAWVAQEEGQLQDQAGKVLYDARIAPPDTDMSDFESLQAALEWVYGDCDWKKKYDPVRDRYVGKVDVAPIIKRIWSPKAKPDDSQRKYLNRPVADRDAWTTPEEWQLLAKPGRQLVPGEQIVLFFDGSKSRDATALVACCMSDGHVFVPRTADGRRTIWEPDTAHDTDDVVPVHDVDLAVKHQPEQFDVVAFFGDVAEWESFVKISWPEWFKGNAKPLLIDAVPSGKDQQPIAWDMRSRTMEFTRAAELTRAEVEGGGFTHDDDPVLARHVANMRVRPNRFGVSVGKESPSSPLKVDAGVCMIGARMVRQLVLASGKKRRRSGSGKVVVLS